MWIIVRCFMFPQYIKLVLSSSKCKRDQELCIVIPGMDLGSTINFHDWYLSTRNISKYCIFGDFFSPKVAHLTIVTQNMRGRLPCPQRFYSRVPFVFKKAPSKLKLDLAHSRQKQGQHVAWYLCCMK